MGDKTLISKLTHEAENRYRKILSLQSQLEASQQEVEKLRELLKVSACPNCDGGGAYYDNMGEVCQCQFCYEREQALQP